MAGNQLVAKDYRVMDFLEAFIAKNGYSPTVREIMAGTSLPAKSIVPSLRKLRRAKFINYRDNCSRTITIIRYSLTPKAIRELNESDI